MFTCDICKTTFSFRSNLKRHLNTKHSNIKQFSCDKCTFQTKTKCILNRHEKVKHSQDTLDTALVVQCALCSFKGSSRNAVEEHYLHGHDLHIKTENIEFSNENEFNLWKSSLEKKQVCQFVKRCGDHRNMDGSLSLYFGCHRDGIFKSVSKNVRRLKLSGSNKIDGYCPGKITAKIDLTGKVYVNFCDIHIGHESDLRRIRLTNEEKNTIAGKIAMHVPFDIILDEIRSSVDSNEFERIHLTTRKDLLNIEQQYSLKTEAVRHKNDYVSVESWINEMVGKGDVVRFYKPQGNLTDTNTVLSRDDFVLIIMNEVQCESLKRLGENCVCIDSTHGLNEYGFLLTTLLVLDDMAQGFPCCFMFSNRSDTPVIELFLSVVRDSIGKALRPKVFMSDMAEELYSAWKSVMEPATHQLFCSWHVDRAWRKNLNKIKTKVKQAEIYKILCTIRTERDETAFNQMFEKAVSNMVADEECKMFGEYLLNEYANNTKSWAYCHRLHAGLNTNMHLERMHGIIKYIYLKGKRPKRLDITIHALMRFVRDKLFERIIYLNKGKITNKLSLLRQRHNRAMLMSAEAMAGPSNKTPWTVLSSKKTELYEIRETDQLKCKCNLRCDECKVCIHAYICSCPDSSIKFNMCKHIHFCLVNFKPTMQNTSSPTPEEDTNDLPVELCIAENANQVELDHLTSHLRGCSSVSSSKPADNLMKKDQIRMHIENILSLTKTDKDLDLVSKFLNPIEPTLKAEIRRREMMCTKPPVSKSVNQRKGFDHQRKFLLAKKPKTSQLAIKKPTLEESQKISATLLVESPQEESPVNN